MTQAIRIFSTCPPSVDVTSKAGPGLAYRDHAQVVELWAGKQHAERPNLVVELHSL